jgi:hypothetical protein
MVKPEQAIVNRSGFTGGSKDRMTWSYGKEQEIEEIFT